jgi:hypothetical protein
MADRLRDWCESLCEAQSDGTWLVRVPSMGQPKWTYLLPDAAMKRDYVARAERVVQADATMDMRESVTTYILISLMTAAGALDLRDVAGGIMLVVFVLFIAAALIFLAISYQKRRNLGRALRDWVATISVAEKSTKNGILRPVRGSGEPQNLVGLAADQPPHVVSAAIRA